VTSGVVDAHIAALLLVIADLLARSLRIQWLLRGVGQRITFKQGFLINIFADAGSAVTPLRLGGEPARIAMMLRSGVSAPAAFVAISYEMIVSWPVLILMGGVLGWRYAPGWWAAAGPALVANARRAWPWLAAVVVLSVLTWLLVRRRVSSPAVRQVRRPLRRAAVYWRRMPAWPILASIPLTMVNIVTRVGILVVLARALPNAPALPTLWVGSFALIYSQLVLPTPSGAGAVELGFLAGAAGDLGPSVHWVLLAWRFYTSGLAVVLGAWAAIHIYGWDVVRLLRRRAKGAEGVAERKG
jgi:uncharacterized membrane protein YbhN (UPF0104 family)